jgi:hypothetical protein
MGELMGLIMKIKYFKIIAAILLLSGSTMAGGKYVTIQLKDSSFISGELISVRDNGLIICPDEGLSEEELSDSLQLLVGLNYNRIAQIAYKYRSGSKLVIPILLGTGLGIASGLIIGTIAFPWANSNNNDIIGSSFSTLKVIMAVVLGSIGFIVGTITGISISDEEQNISNLSSDEIETLKSFSRYDKGEPGFLQQVQIE